MLSDLIIALRQLRRAPAQTVIAVFTLALGIGLSVTMGSVLKALMLDPFNYPRPDRIVQVSSAVTPRPLSSGFSEESTVAGAPAQSPLSSPDYKDLHEQAASFELLGGYAAIRCNVGGAAPAFLEGVLCSAEVLRILGAKPMLGRTLQPGDELPGAGPVAVISDAAWQRLFARDPAVIGRHVPVDGKDTEIVGVLPPDFEFRVALFNDSGSDAPAMWRPLAPMSRTNRSNHWFMGLARLKDGVSAQAADAECKTIGSRLEKSYPETNARKSFMLTTLHEELRRDNGLARNWWMPFGAGTLLLLLACSNVASMLIAQGTARQHEFSVRLALGASRWSLARLVLAESMILAAGGALAGLVVAWWGAGALANITPMPPGREAAVHVDGLLLLFAMALAVATTVLVGLPAAFATRDSAAADALRSGGRGQAGSRGRQRLLRSLIIAQVAVALLLANTSVLFAASYRKLRMANEVMATDRVLALHFVLGGQRYAKGNARMLFLEQLLERAKGLPGVREAAVASKIPLRGGNNNTIFAGKPGEWRNLGQMEITPVSRGYFSAAGLALLKGRAFDPGDADGQAGHVVVNRTLANLAWPGKDALGKMLFPYSMILDTPESAGAKAMTVVGVVEDAPQRGVRERMTGEIYQLSQGESFSRLVFAYLVVRSSQDARPLGKLLQREVAAIDPEQPFRIMTWRSVLDMATQLERFLMMLMIVFTVCAIGLAMVGIYGTFSYYVAERTKEIGLRMALGATRAGVVGTVLRRLGVWMGIGLALGAGGVFAGARYLQAMLFEMEPVHPPVLIASVALVLATGLLAGLIPALRATKIQPLEALRAE